jgi:hypothetical protein
LARHGPATLILETDEAALMPQVRKDSTMGQREYNPAGMFAFSGSTYGGVTSRLASPASASDADAPLISSPVDLLEAPIPGWDNAWIDLGGEA